MRQSCDHVSLTVKKKQLEGRFEANERRSEIAQLKDSHEVARVESSDGGEGTIDDNVSKISGTALIKLTTYISLIFTCPIPCHLFCGYQFLSNLLNKFKNDANVGSTFAKQVAESLSQCVQSSDDCLKSECPICLEEPRVEDAVHSECLFF